MVKHKRKRGRNNGNTGLRLRKHTGSRRHKEIHWRNMEKKKRKRNTRTNKIK